MGCTKDQSGSGIPHALRFILFMALLPIALPASTGVPSAGCDASRRPPARSCAPGDAAFIPPRTEALPTMDWISMKADMPHPVYWAATASWNGKIYVVGGISGLTGTDTNIMQVYDIATDTWTMGPPRVQSVRLASACAIDGKIHVTGGRDESAPWDYHEVFNVATQTWAIAKKLPSVLRGHNAVAVGGKLYTFGGNRGTASAIYSNTVNIYDPATDAWTTGQVSPVRWAYGGADYDATTGKVFFVAGDNGSCTDCAGQFPKQSYGYHVASNTWDATAASYAALITGFPGVHMQAVAAANGKVYSFGGGYYDGYSDRAPFPFVLVLDAASNTWASAPSVPDPIERLSPMALAEGGSIFVLGGLPDGQWLQTVDFLDLADDAWFAPYPDSDEPRQGPIVQAVGTKLYAIGGWYNGYATGSVMVFDTAARTGAWYTASAVDPTSRYAAASGVWNGKIVVSGGAATDGTPVVGNAVLYDPATDIFTPLAADPAVRSGASGAVVGDHFYVFGGSDSAGTPVALASDLNLATGTWTSLSPLPIAIDGASAVAMGGKVYIFGGFDGTASPDNGLHDKVFIFDPATGGYSEGAESPYAVIYGAAAAYGNYIVVDSGLHRYYDDDMATVYAEMAQTQTIYHPATDTFTTAPRPWGKWYHGAAVVADKLYSVLGVDWSYFCTRTDVAQLGSSSPTCTLTCTAAAAPDFGSPPLVVNFTSTATATNCTGSPTFAWDFGDGQTSTAQNPSHIYASLGTYTWALTVSVEDQTCTQTGSVEVVPMPSLAIGDASGGVGETVTVPITLTTEGATVCGTSDKIAYDFGRLDYVESLLGPAGQAAGKQLFVNQNPTTRVITLAVIGFNTTPISDGIVAYVRFAVRAGATGIVTLQNQCAFSDCAGHDGIANCADGSVTVTLPCTLTCAAAAPAVGTAGVPIAFEGNAVQVGCAVGPSFLWDFGDGGTSSLQNPTHAYAGAGTYGWSMTADAEGITCSQDGSILIHCTVEPIVTGPGAACSDTGALLSTQTYSSYQWIRDGEVLGGATERTYVASDAGTHGYSVRVTDASGCQETSATHSVTIHALPAPTISGPSPACQTANLSTQVYSSFQWFRDGAEIPGATAQSFLAPSPGSYSVRVTDENGCAGFSPVFAVAESPNPTISGATQGCTVPLSTGTYATYQWYRNGNPLLGANGQSYIAEWSGTYTVTVTDANGCGGTSYGKSVTAWTPHPTVSGASENVCPITGVPLQTEPYASYQWTFDGVPIPGATARTYVATTSGSYAAQVIGPEGCPATSPPHAVSVTFCPTSEVSPQGAIFPLRVVRSSASGTGYFIYFQNLDAIQGLNLYEGTLETWYSHGEAEGNRCGLDVVNLGTGEMRAELEPSAGDQYYLLTAFGEGAQGPSGFDSGNNEIPPKLNTCPP